MNPLSIRSSRLGLFAAVLLAALLPLNGCDLFPHPGRASTVVVANRASGTVSVINTRTDEVMNTITPPGPNTPEPMYVVYSRAQHRVFVGDRANDHVVAYDADDMTVEGTAPATGIFHMWADEIDGTQLWVVDNVNNQVTVIDPTTLAVITTVPVPDGVPHDVIVDPQGDFAFVTVFVDGGPDLVLKFSTDTFAEVDRATVGEDPHVSLARQHNRLYVPNQNTDQLLVFNRHTLDPIGDLAIPGAHGAGMTNNGAVFYTTNLPGGGTDGLFAIDTATNTVLGSADTPFPTPHNVAVTSDRRKLYVTHSGAAADQVTVYSIRPGQPVPVFEATVTVELNPFGLAFVPAH